MLIRILSDNPGRSFTRNFDKKFVDTVKDLLKGAWSGRVRQLLMETLDHLEYTKADYEGVADLVAMWRKEKSRVLKYHGVSSCLDQLIRFCLPRISPSQPGTHTNLGRDRRDRRDRRYRYRYLRPNRCRTMIPRRRKTTSPAIIQTGRYPAPWSLLAASRKLVHRPNS